MINIDDVYLELYECNKRVALAVAGRSEQEQQETHNIFQSMCAQYFLNDDHFPLKCKSQILQDELDLSKWPEKTDLHLMSDHKQMIDMFSFVDPDWSNLLLSHEQEIKQQDTIKHLLAKTMEVMMNENQDKKIRQDIFNLLNQHGLSEQSNYIKNRKKGSTWEYFYKVRDDIFIGLFVKNQINFFNQNHKDQTQQFVLQLFEKCDEKLTSLHDAIQSTLGTQPSTKNLKV